VPRKIRRKPLGNAFIQKSSSRRLHLAKVGILVRQKLAQRILATVNAGEAIECRFNGLIFCHAFELHKGLNIFHEGISRQASQLTFLVFHDGNAVNHLRIAAGQWATIPEGIDFVRFHNQILATFQVSAIGCV
jgi:hypothetical protein